MKSKLQQIKQKLLPALHQDLSTRIAELALSLEQTREALDAEGKSSMGDKYETGREMIGIEMAKLDEQLFRLQKQVADLHKIEANADSTHVHPGSLVQCESRYYFIAIAHGKLVIDELEILVISAESPMGKLLMNRTSGDEFAFQGRRIVLTDVV